jgi:endonuclease YncB( thermonuclease family)
VINKHFCCAVVLGLAAIGAVGKTPAKAKPAPAPAQPVELTGSVSRIVDGDTLWLRTAEGSEPTVIRIEGIDAPERCQPGGKEATAALTDLALNRSVTVRVVAHDDWGRTVGKVFDGGKDLGDRMVRDGHAWSTRFKYDRGPYMAEERMAQSLKRGLHAEGGAIQPREFRQRYGPCQGDAAAPATAPAVAPSAAPAALPAAISAAPRCDGRQFCSQMSSCDEAKWFLKNCPGVKMDGNRDGVPCEKQWCRAPR